MTRCIFSSLLTAVLLGLPVVLAPLAPVAMAQDDRGIPVQITVTDATGAPVATASVRHPDEKYPHEVNKVDGSVEIRELYMPDGSELIMEKGTVLKLEVSAPGYQNYDFTYVVRKRRNAVSIALTPLDLEDDTEEMDDPIIQFHRDRPRD